MCVLASCTVDKIVGDLMVATFTPNFKSIASPVSKIYRFYDIKMAFMWSEATPTTGGKLYSDDRMIRTLLPSLHRWLQWFGSKPLNLPKFDMGVT